MLCRATILISALVLVNAGLAAGLLDNADDLSRHSVFVIPIVLTTALAVGTAVAHDAARKREAALHEKQARVAGVQLAARTATNLINNRLSVTRGWVEELAQDPRLPPDLREMAERAQRSATVAAETLRQLERVTDVVEVDHGPWAGTTLDLDRSIGPRECGAVGGDETLLQVLQRTLQRSHALIREADTLQERSRRAYEAAQQALRRSWERAHVDFGQRLRSRRQVTYVGKDAACSEGVPLSRTTSQRA